MKNLYQTKKEYYLRHIFPRGRILSQIEDDLLIFSQLIISLNGTKKDAFEKKFDQEYAKLHDLKPKTIKNHRTEMISLFGLTIMNEDSIVEASDRVRLLIESQNFQLFFKTFCNRFQFPNAINKPQETEKQLRHNVRFKPAKFLLQLFIAGRKRFGDTFKVTGAEISNLIFNDLRVTTGQISPERILDSMINMRKGKVNFEGNSRQSQHGREFLDYMYLAGLLDSNDKNRTFFLNAKEMSSVNFILENKSFFEIPKKYITDVKVRKSTVIKWQYWFGEVDKIEIAKLDSSKETLDEIEKQVTRKFTKEEKLASPVLISKKDSGDVGERIVFKYERWQISSIRPDKASLVKLVSNDTSLGYDIQSFELKDVSRKKLIEVKTTIRTFEPGTEIVTYFPMSSNEWETAKNYPESYYIYRVFLTKKSAKILIIKNPVEENKRGNIMLEPTEYRILIKDGAGEYLPDIKI